MSIRLRATDDDGHQKEYLFNRKKVSIGEGPFCDIALKRSESRNSSGEPQSDARALVTLTQGEGREVICRLNASRTPIELIRDGEVAGDWSDHQPVDFPVREGDTLDISFEDGLRIEIIEIEPSSSVDYDIENLQARSEVSLKASTAKLQASALEALARDPTPELFLRAAAMLGDHLVPFDIQKLELAVLVDPQDWKSHNYRLTELTVPKRTKGSELAVSEISGRFSSAPNSLPTFGIKNVSILEDLKRGRRAVFYDTSEETSLFVPLHVDDLVCGVLDIELDQLVQTDERNANHFGLHELYAALHSLSEVLLRIFRQSRQNTDLLEEIRYFENQQKRRFLEKDLVDESDAMKRVHRQIEQWDQTKKPVLIIGEAGTGKQLLARKLHHQQKDKKGLLVSLDCSRFDNEALDLQLFGCTDRADFPELKSRKGIFELAEGGTVFLKEIDTLPLALQAKVLRAIRENEVRRLGDALGRHVDTQLVASTHRDLQTLVNQGSFRQDLYVSIKKRTLWVPPLRKRRRDILPLANTFLEKFARRYERPCRKFDPEASTRLRKHDWPGNVRELQTVIEAAVLNCGTESVITPEQFAL